jgi:hypothetical protein
MPQCNLIHNRDKNAVQNMLNIVESIFNTGKRPIKFTRETKSIQSIDFINIKASL